MPGTSNEELAKKQEQAFDTYHRGVALARKQPRPASVLEPSWGEPELLMSLAWSSLNQLKPDVGAAEKYAQDCAGPGAQLALREERPHAADPHREEPGVTMRLTYAIVAVSDMKESVGFYRDQLGLPLRFESPAWTEFNTEGATLALHSTLHSSHGDKPGTSRPGLSVADLDAFHARMTGLGIACVQPPKEVFGARIAQYVDPDGLTISVSEERKR